VFRNALTRESFFQKYVNDYRYGTVLVDCYFDAALIPATDAIPAPSLIVAFRIQNEIISLRKILVASSQLEKRSP
jgi:hypothetical protein